jgi:predicted AAA+ superfamily ATPase
MINKEILRTVIQEQQENSLPELCVVRDLPFDMTALRESSSIVIITGIRRSGKSTWLHQLRLSNDEHHYYLNFDDDRLQGFELDDFQMLLELFIELYGQERHFYFDEIQNIEGWERFVRRLHDQKNKIFITGSNATMFSEELGTRLTGRYVKYEIFPFSFSEYLAFKGYQYDMNVTTSTVKATLNRYYREYSEVGGFTEYIKYGQLEYLQGLYESILYRDIVVRYKLPSDRVIKALMYYVASNAGKLVTYNSLKNLLQVPSANTISDYCGYLQNSYLSFLVNRFDRSLKKQSFAPKKVYCIDNGLARAVGFRASEDRGHLLENIVFLALKREGYTIYYHQDQYECDFIVQKTNKTVCAIQVCYAMDDPNIQERELRGLREAMNAHQLQEGFIITAHQREKFDNIHIIPVTEFLLRRVQQSSP